MTRLPETIAAAWRNLHATPGRAPRGLERLASLCLRAEPRDSRLGDLSEQYVRTHQGMTAWLGTAPWAMTVSHIAADLCYLAASANVILFARAIDPGLRLVENGAAALIALDLRERTMATLRIAAGKLVLPGLLLVGSALLVSGAVDAWRTWRQTEALMARLQREQAEAAAARIEQFLAGVQGQIGWTTHATWGAGPLDQRRFDYIRLLRQVAAITEIAQLDPAGREVLRASRLALDKVDSGADFSDDVRFTEAVARGKYFGPVYFRKQSEPYVSLAVARAGLNNGVTLAEINLRPVWDAARAARVGESGYAYIVDGKGRLIAHPDISLVLRQPDLSALPQVAAALSASPSAPKAEPGTFDTSISGSPVRSVRAAIPTLGWQVFVELPAAEARAPLWSALIRGVGLLGLGLVAALLASLLATRRAARAQLAHSS